MNDIGSRLDEALSTVIAGTAPVEATMRRGRGIRVRRRVAAVTGVAALAALAGLAAFGYPAALARWNAVPAPATQRGTITVRPPGPGSPAGLVASGTVDGKPWQLSVPPPRSGGRCLFLLTQGSALNEDVGLCTQIFARVAEPVDFIDVERQPGDSLGADAGSVDAIFGQVRSDVDRVLVTLGDGTELTLHPADWYGHRFVAYAAPASMNVESVIAYSRTGEIGTAIPFKLPGLPVVVEKWLAPNTRPHFRATNVISSGTDHGVSSSITAYEGPWGTCFTGPTLAYMHCVPLAAITATSVLGQAGSPPIMAYGSAAASVSRLRVTLSGGSSDWVRPVRVGDEKLFAIALKGNGQSVRHWTAYDAAGKVVASGNS